MRITHSSEISEILTRMARQKHLKYARPLALYSTAANTAEAEAFVKVVCGKYPGAPSLVRGVAKTSDTSFYFDKPEAQVLQELANVKVPRKGKTAPKVMARMVYTRLIKVKAAVDNVKECIRKDHGAYWSQYSAPDLTFEGLRDVGEFRKSTHNVRQLMEDLVAVTTREDITPEILEQAWDLFQAHCVMDS